MELNAKITGTRIKEIREENGLSQEEFGKIFSKTRYTVWRWEKGEAPNLSVGQIKKMGTMFGVNELWLMGYDDIPKYKVCSENKEMIAEIENLLPSMTSANLKIVLTLVKELSK